MLKDKNILNRGAGIILPFFAYHFISYRVLRPPPIISSAPSSNKRCRSLVAVALEALVIEMYFFALIPPSNPPGPSSSMRRKTFSCRSFSFPENRSKNRAFFRVNAIYTAQAFCECEQAFFHVAKIIPEVEPVFPLPIVAHELINLPIRLKNRIFLSRIQFLFGSFSSRLPGEKIACLK